MNNLGRTNGSLYFARSIRVLLVFAFACAPGLRGGRASAPEGKPQRRITYDFFVDVVAYLYARQFDAIEEKFREHEEYFEDDYEGESEAGLAFAVFRQADPAVQDIVEDWATDFPDSYVALLALGSYFEELGWRRRDHRFASETTEIQFREMEDAFQRAIVAFQKTASLRPKLTVSYAELIDIYRALGDREQCDRWLQRALEEKPASSIVRFHYIEALRPRWGGSIEEMQAFAKNAEELGDANPRLLKLHGMVSSELAEQAFPTDKRKALALHEEALSFGEDSFWLYRKAETLDALGEHKDAIAVASRALDLTPGWVSPMVLRANLKAKTGDREGALDDIARALRIDSHNPYALLARGSVNLRGEAYLESLADIEKALSVRPYWDEAWLRKGWLLVEHLNRVDEGIEAWERAGELGSANAQLALGWRYLHGAERDYEKAYRWYSAAAESGDANAMCQLGLMYQKGNFVEQNLSEATHWYFRSAQAGFHTARYNLGLLYLFGNGVEQDVVRGYLLIASAAELGEKHSMEYVSTMQSHMTPDQLEEGRRRLAGGETGLEQPR